MPATERKAYRANIIHVICFGLLEPNQIKSISIQVFKGLTDE